MVTVVQLGGVELEMHVLVVHAGRNAERRDGCLDEAD